MLIKPWSELNFPETTAAAVADVSKGRADTRQDESQDESQEEVKDGPALLDRARTLWNAFLGHAWAVRIATILAFAVLTGQVLYSQFDDWSKTAALRPLYSGICTVLGCELPVRRSVGQFQSRKLAVRSHPEKEGSLLVDALIINEADFEQPFPVLELQFMDIQQRLVSSYTLEPSAYLDGELAGSTELMAVQTPVHIDIDVPDPGPKAVNYQLQFR